MVRDSHAGLEEPLACILIWDHIVFECPSLPPDRSSIDRLHALQGDGVASITTSDASRVSYLHARFKRHKVTELHLIEDTVKDCVFART